MTIGPQTYSVEERRARLQRLVEKHLQDGARIESQTDLMVVVVRGHRVNHILHFLLGFPTLGLWWFVWLGLAIWGGEQRTMLTIDERGVPLEKGL